MTIDVRERELMCILDGIHFKYTTSSLPVGDIIIASESMELLLERKTLADLDASIVDGRYSDQKRRMFAWAAAAAEDATDEVANGKKCRRVAYILETDMFSMFAAASAASIGAYLNSSIRDGILLFRTLSIHETAGLIKEAAQRIASYKVTPNMVTCTQVIIKPVPKNLAHPKPRDNRGASASECLLRQLCQIPSISEKKARAIQQVTKASSMAELIRLIDSQGIQKVLSPVPGIGPKLVQSIQQALL